MKTLVVGWALVVALLLGPVLARPNLVEPIYLRRRSNPLEIVEESVEAGSAAANGSSPSSSSSEQSIEPVSGETTNTPQQTGAAAAAAEAASDATIGTTGATSERTTHQPSYAYKRPSELLKTKIGTSGFVVSTSTKVLTGQGDRTPSSGSLSLKSGEAKANDQLTLSFQDRFTGHAGVAEPLTDEEYQNELHRATERVPVRTTTPREGLSTWVLLSGSDSTETKAESTSTTTRKIMQTTTVKPVAMGSTTKRFQTPTMRRNLPTTTQRPVKTTTTSVVEEKKEKPTKPIPKQKVATTTLKPVIVKKVKKPPTTTAATTTTTTTTTTTPKPSTTKTTSTTTSTSTTTELVLTEQTASTVANDGPPARADEPAGVDSESDSSVETSTFLIMEPKDAMFDLPEDRSPSKVAPAATKTKKVTRKPNVKSPANGGGGAASGTKKKPANKKNRKPEVKDGVAKPPNKNGAAKPVSTQIINYLSREVMPTVGVGLVGLVMAAGLASYFLGSPLGALRRSDDRKDDLYYSNYEEYAGPDGQNEEDVFGKLIAGMPDRSYYRNSGNVRRRIQQQPQQQQQQQQAPVRTGHQYYHVQPYTGNKYPHITYRNRAYGGANAPEMYSNINRQAQVQPKSQNLAPEFHYTPPTPYYPARMNAATSELATGRPAPPMAPVYSASVTQAPVPTTTTTTTTALPGTESPQQDAEVEHEMMPHPEAYSSEHSPEHHAHYVVGGVGGSYADSMLEMINSASMPEHGPRRKRAAVRSASSEEADFDNEINVDDDEEEGYPKEVVNTADNDEAQVQTETEGDNMTPSTTTMSPEMTSTTEGHRYTWGDFIRNTVERKVKLGLNFLQHVTMDFQRYLNGVQEHLVQHSSTEPAEHQ